VTKVYLPGIKFEPPTITSDGNDAAALVDGDGAALVDGDGLALTDGASPSLSIDEGETDVTTITATQAHGGGPITYAISGGDDAALFDIIPSTGLLYFLAAPAFDTPLDANTDNVYEVEVTATGRGGLTDTQAITVTVEEGGGDWILAAGVWNDAGVWDDVSSWMDT
jgi:hypothetical protein